jgi:hypothetical protein
VRLALVSKSLAESAEHILETHGASITLELADEVNEQQQLLEDERLVGLGNWLGRYGHLVTTLDVHRLMAARKSPWYINAEGVAHIIEQLVAAQTASGGLRLQQLRLPALGSTTGNTLGKVVLGSPQLRALTLDARSGYFMPRRGDFFGTLSKRLQQMTQLTSLCLHGAHFHYCKGAKKTVDVNPWVQRLPSSLVVLEMTSLHDGGDGPQRYFTLQSTSLRHLVHLQKLTLPMGLYLDSSPDDEDVPNMDATQALADLTALTYLDVQRVHCGAKTLLPLPHLVEVRAWCLSQDNLTELSNKSTLRALTCRARGAGAAAALAQLTQLTSLGLSVAPHQEPAYWPTVRIDRPSGPPHVEALRLTAVAALPYAMALTELRSLSVEAAALEEVDLSPLCNLKRLELLLLGAYAKDCTPERMGALLQRLAPMQGQLQELAVVACAASQREVWRAAVADALGGVQVVFT